MVTSAQKLVNVTQKIEHIENSKSFKENENYGKTSVKMNEIRPKMAKIGIITLLVLRLREH